MWKWTLILHKESKKQVSSYFSFFAKCSSCQMSLESSHCKVIEQCKEKKCTYEKHTYQCKYLLCIVTDETVKVWGIPAFF